MGQIHFLVLEQNNEAPIAVDPRQFLDMTQVPFWSGTARSLVSRSDGLSRHECRRFRLPLPHSQAGDEGMMAIIRVRPASP
jgi:hypothetical protein